MIRQYRAFEDLEEPCFMVPEKNCITVTYQMKSIITKWFWADIKHFKVFNLQKTVTDTGGETNKNNNSSSNKNNKKKNNNNNNQPSMKNGTKVARKQNLLKIRLKSGQLQWYRFESRLMLDEFLSDVIRHQHAERVLCKRWLRTKVKYVPVEIADNEKVL